jgi:cytochrome P450
MAYLAYLLACHPEASQVAMEEVQQLLISTGRVSSDGSGDVALLTAEDVASLPFLIGCVNETLRLAPAGTVLTRSAAQARLFVCMSGILQA